MPRVFFAVWPDQAAAEALSDAATAAQATCGGRTMRLETLHLTLAFLGDLPVARVDVAKRIADGVTAASFDLVLDQLGYWRHNRILWASGGVPAGLTFIAGSLQRDLRAAGFALDARAFAPHVTLLRDAHCADMPTLAQPIRWPVREFVLAESRLSSAGARYDIIGRWPLP